MSLKSKDTQAAKPGLQPSFAKDTFGLYISITCGSVSGQLYVDKLDESKRSPGKCVLVNGSWYTPSEVEALGGKKAKKWRQSLSHMGKPLSVYNLSCTHQQGTIHKQADLVSQVGLSSEHRQDVSVSLGDVTSVSDSVLLSSHSPVASSTQCSLIVDTALSFIKAYRLKGDNDSLRRIVCERFTSEAIVVAKRLLWDSCEHDLETAGLSFQVRRDSDKRSQLVANLDDILRAFETLDNLDLIPAIYCEATELLKLPSLSLDPVAEQVQVNSQALESLISKVGGLEEKLSSFLAASTSTSSIPNSHDGVNTQSYAAVASSVLPSPSVAATGASSASLHRNVSKRSQQSDNRDLNLILFGLPESGSIVDGKVVVDEILEFLANKPIPIKDMFRLGKFSHSSTLSSSARPRPILIKLSTAWDRKLILLQKSKLRDFHISRLFLREDVSPDHRLRQRKSKSTALNDRPASEHKLQQGKPKSSGLLDVHSSSLSHFSPGQSSASPTTAPMVSHSVPSLSHVTSNSRAGLLSRGSPLPSSQASVYKRCCRSASPAYTSLSSSSSSSKNAQVSESCHNGSP